VSGTTEQVQPERLIVACHPGNALNEPWHLAVRDRVLPHTFPNAVRSERVPLHNFLRSQSKPRTGGELMTPL
jgi:hypothetical protein